MTIEPECLQASVPSPLEGFDFTRDWLQGNSIARGFLPDIDTQVNHRLAALQKKPWQPWSSDDAAVVRNFNNSFGNQQGAAYADFLVQPDTLVVVTGQQPNLLVSPLYILHKALSARAWAVRLGKQMGRQIIPVFWVASDDDDFAELKQAWHIAEDGSIRDAGSRVSRGGGLESGTPAFRWDLGESASRLKEELATTLSHMPGGHETAEWLGQALDRHGNFETLFCHLLAELLGPDNPMLFIAPRLKPMRDRQVSVLYADVELHATVNKAISAEATRFEAAGFPVTLKREPLSRSTLEV